ncbi:GxxExxY protein [Kiritimatiellaeota bacterium B1221]|nr:GxxExxY protein [Kiritimatiellaeota bacterium B1221]
MPVTCTEIIHEIDESGFRETDYLMTGCAFDSHNALGNLVREEGHKNDLVARAREKGLQIKPEVQFIVRFNTFSRRFPCDLLVENSIIYECKTTSAFHARHLTQLLNYLFLANLRFGKLFNFALPSFASEFVSTRYTLKDRQKILINTQDWTPPATGIPIDECVSALLSDWGAGLSRHLYEDALLHFLGPGQIQKKEIPVCRENTFLCHQPLLQLTDGSALHITSFPHLNRSQATNLLKLKALTRLKQLHWINFALPEITFRTL